MRRKYAGILCALLLLLPFAAQAQDRPLVVFAAASLRTALDEAVDLWQAQTQQPVTVSYAGSSTLARQLTAGAEADVFISANDKWMDYLVKAGRVAPEAPRLLLGNQLVLVAPADSQARAAGDVTAATLKAALGSGYLAMADRSVPAGSYGLAALTALGLWPQLESRVAWAQDVRAALALVAKGGAPLGIVYRTDAAAASGEVKVLAPFAAGTHPPIRYPLAVLAASRHAAAQDFAAFLASPAAQAIFTKNGFTLPAADAAQASRTPAVATAPHDDDSKVWMAVSLSLKVGFWAVLLSFPLALWLALLMARRQFRGKWLLDALIHLPLVLPPVVTGYVLLLLFGKSSLLGQWLEALGVPLAFHLGGAVLAAAVMGFPLLVRAIRLSAEAQDRRFEQVASTLGAHPLRVFLTVTLPLLLPGIGSGMVLSFARAMGEFGATITFVANIPGVTQTLPLAIFTAIQTPGPLASRDTLLLIGLSLGISLAALVLAEWWIQKARRRVLPCS